MANTNPHTGSGSKIVSVLNLQRYHHQLVSALGLVQDTAEYKYAGTRKDFPSDVTTLSAAVSKVFDLTKAGGVTFADGKKADADPDAGETYSVSTVQFNSDDEKSDNKYWINAKVGDDYVNICLDANNFVKDSVLESIALITKTTTGEGATATVSYKLNGLDATLTPANTTDPAKLEAGGTTIYVDTDANDQIKNLEDGTSFYYTWKVNNGEVGTTRSYTAIALKDVYGDLSDDGKGYVKYDATKAEISVDTAELVEVDGTKTTTYYWTLDDVNGGKVYADAEKTQLIKSYPDVNTFTSFETALIADGYTDFDTTTHTCKKTVDDPDNKVYKVQVYDAEQAKYVDPADNTNLATAENLAEVANALKGEIKEAADKVNAIQGDDYISYSNGQISAEVAEVVTTNKLVSYTYKMYQDGADEDTVIDSVIVYDADGEEVESFFDFTHTIVGGKAILADAGYIDISNPTKVGGSWNGTCKKSLTKWETDGDDETNLATAENLADVANALDAKIQAASGDLSLNDGEVVFDDDEDATNKLEVVEDTTGKHYKLTLKIASDDDITSMFAKCVAPTVDTQNLAFLTDENGDATVDNAGLYKISDDANASFTVEKKN